MSGIGSAPPEVTTLPLLMRALRTRKTMRINGQGSGIRMCALHGIVCLHVGCDAALLLLAGLSIRDDALRETDMG